MKQKILILTAAALVAFGGTVNAQKRDESQKKWESAQSRQIPPEVRTFVTPQICDMQMLSKGREVFGPYYFNLNASIENVLMGEIRNDEARALYRACKEADADAIIEPMYDSYVYDKDTKVLVVELSGYPVKYTNFRPATKNEVDMIGVVYPSTNTSVSVNTGEKNEERK